MEFRKTACAWCSLRNEALDGCRPCPKYARYVLGKTGVLRADDFCRLCANRDNPELSIYCDRNRFYQDDPEEDFDCYKFMLIRG